MPDPLPLTHPRIAGLGRSDFIIAPSNAVALAMLDGWASWPRGKLVLTGPAGAGKTHLAHIWAEDTGAGIVPGTGLAARDIPALAAGPLVVEDVDDITDPADEEALFHLHNLMLVEGHPLLLTGARAVAGWPLTLPDLRSRLQQAQSAVLEAPDDALLATLLAKLFVERQLQVPRAVIDYLIRRMDRSFDGARRLVAALDQASLAQTRAITTRLAAEVMDKQEARES
ncbi:HdaA/DnaA family protein [Pseudooceanicola onchidii]|uniref:HdaA/DnaA family protein n=1 Tax=Pseudooceanicola onchidii TaxID=2562279 RepID=UPI0010AA20EF|nr:DnaA/Hda family protein [Pseudooceanicola onchidii]